MLGGLRDLGGVGRDWMRGRERGFGFGCVDGDEMGFEVVVGLARMSEVEIERLRLGGGESGLGWEEVGRG